MPAISLLLWCGLVLYLCYALVTSQVARRRHYKYAAQHGCKTALKINPDSYVPLNLDFGRKLFSLSKQGIDILDEIFLPAFDRLGHTLGLYSSFTKTVILTAEPANIQAVLASKFVDYELGHVRKKAFGVALGKAIFTSDGRQWEHSRALFRPQFSRELINNLDFTEQATKTLFRVVGEPAPGEWTSLIDMVPVFLRFTLDTSTEFLFGRSANSQSISLTGNKEDCADAAAFAEAFTEIQEKMVLRIRAGRLYWAVDSFKLRRAVRTIRGFITPLVQQAMSIRGSDPEMKGAAEKEGAYSLIEALARSNISETELRDQLLSLLAAGRDTTSTLLSWAVLMLALYPKEFAKLRRAVIDDLGSETDPTGMDFQKLKSCKYMSYVLNETLRLFPSVPINARVAVRDTVIPKGGGPDRQSPIALRKDDVVTFCVYAMHRRKDLWGEDAWEFKPERWIGRKNDWSFLPFNGGPRVCLGQQYALIEASYLLARILQHYDAVELGPGYPADLINGKWTGPKVDGITKFPKNVTVRFRRSR